MERYSLKAAPFSSTSSSEEGESTTSFDFHPVFLSEEEIKQLIIKLDDLLANGPLTSSEVAEAVELYRLRRDLYVRLGDIASAVKDELKVLELERLLLKKTEEELRNLLGDTWADEWLNNPLHFWPKGFSKFREGLAHLLNSASSSEEENKGVEALLEAAKVGIPEAFLVLKALHLPLPEVSNLDSWLKKALLDDFKGALEEIETLYNEDSLEYDILMSAALVHLLSGDLLKAKDLLQKMGLSWANHPEIIAPEFEQFLNSAMQAAEIEKLFNL